MRLTAELASSLYEMAAIVADEVAGPPPTQEEKDAALETIREIVHPSPAVDLDTLAEMDRLRKVALSAKGTLTHVLGYLPCKEDREIVRSIVECIDDVLKEGQRDA